MNVLVKDNCVKENVIDTFVLLHICKEERQLNAIAKGICAKVNEIDIFVLHHSYKEET